MDRLTFTRIAIFASLLIAATAHGMTLEKLPAIGKQPIVSTPQGRQLTLYTNSHALLISASGYLGIGQGGWRPLETTKSDMDKVAATLRKQGFQVWRVSDPTGDELRTVIADFMAEYGHAAENRIVFFFSGHGHTNPNNKAGYIIPIDAKDPARYPNEFYKKALPIRDLLTAALNIESRHALFIFDSCFSGSIFSLKSFSSPEADSIPLADRWRFLSEKAKLPVRQFIAAGGPNEELPGLSVFVPMFIRALEYGVAGARDDGFITGKELGQWIEQNLPSVNKSQNPHSDVVREDGFQFGDIVFQYSSPSPSTPKVAASTAIPSPTGTVETEEQRWSAAKTENTPTAYFHFLSLHPNGKFSLEALALAQTAGKAAPAAKRPEVLPVAGDATFWVYLGLANKERLSSSTFKTTQLPKEGDRIVASVAVSTRASPPKFIKDNWVLGKSIGALKPSNSVVVRRLEKIESDKEGVDVVWAEVGAS